MKKYFSILILLIFISAFFAVVNKTIAQSDDETDWDTSGYEYDTNDPYGDISDEELESYEEDAYYDDYEADDTSGYEDDKIDWDTSGYDDYETDWDTSGYDDYTTCGSDAHESDGECYCNDGHTANNNGDCETMDLATTQCESDGDCIYFYGYDYTCASDGNCVPDSIVGSECGDNSDCLRNYGEGYICSGFIQKTCELSSRSSSGSTSSTPGASIKLPLGASVQLPAGVSKAVSLLTQPITVSIPNVGTITLPAGAEYDSSNGTATVANSDGTKTTYNVPSGTIPSSALSVSNSATNALSGCGVGFESIGGVCFPSNTGLPNPAGGITQILSNIFSWLMGLFMGFSVMAFIISGIQYLTSAGDTDQIETAKRNATYSLLGVIVGLSGFIIIQAIAKALSGNSIFF